MALKTGRCFTYNNYGDLFIETTGAHGPDIAAQRLDDLDRASLQFALSTHSGNHWAVDIGCGRGTQGLRFATLGFKTLLVDLQENSQRCAIINSLLGNSQVVALQSDVRGLGPADLPDKIKILYSQRFIHYLTWEEAVSLLSNLSKRMPVGARAFISAGGIDTEYGLAYVHRSLPVTERFAHLSPDMAEQHHIREKVCLYSCEDLAKLCKRVGLDPVNIWVSEFGNIKGEFARI